MHSRYPPHLPFTLFLLFPLILLLLTTNAALPSSGGQWQLLQQNLGIVAMHMQLLHTDHVIIFDRTDFGPSNLSLPSTCCVDPNDRALTTDCTAHSLLYDVVSNSFRPLNVLTDVWCSSGAVSPNGSLIQTGGFNDGERVVRVFSPCETTSSCDWQELGNQLLARRWYATNHILPGGDVIVIGGRRAFSYEFFPKSGSSGSLYSLRFLVQTNDPKIENNLYPFVFLNVDGNLFIFANTQSILFNYTRNAVVRTFPSIPGSDPRCYPSTGSAVLLPFKSLEPGSVVEAEVLVCGGAPKGSYVQATQGQFVGALNTCGRIKITDPNPFWEMDTMPLPRVMGDMVILPNRRVLIINGASAGSAGWENGQNPVLAPVIYNPDGVTGSRFEIQTESTIPRMYHSTAILIRDGRVLVGGSNPHVGYNFSHVQYPTELRLEAYSPSYLDASVAGLRPIVVNSENLSRIGYGDLLEVRFRVTETVDVTKVEVTVLAPPFTTHSFSMSQRLLVLSAVGNVTALCSSVYKVSVMAPNSANLAPMGYYLLFVVHHDIPSEGVWVQIL